MFGTIGVIASQSNISYINRIINNSNFTVITGWAGGNASVSVSGGNLLITGSGTNSYTYGNYAGATTYASGKKIYVRVKFKVTNANCQEVETRLTATGMALQLEQLQATPLNGTEYTKSTIETLPDGGSGNIQCQVDARYVDAATASGKVLEIIEIMLIDLDLDGLTSYTQIQLDALPFKA